MITGKIHSIETSGFFDGPGIRTVVFFQGCPLRCIYCHNPDTWEFGKGEEYDVTSLMKVILKYKNYYRTSGGGVTFSGGEPLMQWDFLLEILRECKKEGINTAIDTSGILIPDLEKLEEIIELTDTVILDIKGSDRDTYRKMTGRERYDLPEFIRILNKYNKKVWGRYVLIKDINDQEEKREKIKNILLSIDHLVKFEVLPFHQMGSFKYKELGLGYQLEGHPETTNQEAKKFQSEAEGTFPVAPTYPQGG